MSDKPFSWGIFFWVLYFGLCAMCPALLVPLFLALIFGCIADATRNGLTDEERAEMRAKELKERAELKELNRKSDENYLKYEKIRKEYEARTQGKQVEEKQTVNKKIEKKDIEGISEYFREHELAKFYDLLREINESKKKKW